MKPVQVKTGYIRGVRGMIVTPILKTGAADPMAVAYPVRTTQQVGIEAVVKTGADDELRGGDILLAYIKEDDIVTAMKLAIQEARFDAQAITKMAGGTLVLDEEDPLNPVVVGWISPSMLQQQNKPVFKCEIYAANHAAGGVVSGYIKYTFFYCKGTVGGETLQEGSWLVPAMSVDCAENPTLANMGPYRKDFVDELPEALLQPGTISGIVTGDADAPLAGVTVTDDNGETTTTDAQGAYTLPVYAGARTLTFTVALYDMDTLEVTVNPGEAVTGEDIQLVLTP